MSVLRAAPALSPLFPAAVGAPQPWAQPLKAAAACKTSQPVCSELLMRLSGQDRKQNLVSNLSWYLKTCPTFSKGRCHQNPFSLPRCWRDSEQVTLSPPKLHLPLTSLLSFTESIPWDRTPIQCGLQPQIQTLCFAFTYYLLKGILPIQITYYLFTYWNMHIVCLDSPEQTTPELSPLALCVTYRLSNDCYNRILKVM